MTQPLSSTPFAGTVTRRLLLGSAALGGAALGTGALHDAVAAGSDPSRDGKLVLLETSTAPVLTLDVTTGRFGRVVRFPDGAVPNYAAWGPRGALFVTDFADNVVWRVPHGSRTARPWFRSPALTGAIEFGTTGIRYRPGQRDLLITQQTVTDGGTLPTDGALYRLPIGADGRPGEIETAGPPSPATSPTASASGAPGTGTSANPAARRTCRAAPPSEERAASLRTVSALAGLLDKGLMAPDWAEALARVDEQVAAMGRFLREELAAGRAYQPAGDRLFRAFQRPLADVRVLIVGQDPYPNPAHPIGLSFAVRRDVWPLPPSLVNIYTELRDDLGIMPPRHGDLTAWADQGVMLLNRSLTVQPGVSNSHRGKGWEPITACAIEALARRGGPLVAILWGSDARNLKPMLGAVPVVESPHPSPLSAYRGFFGSRPFSRANALLVEQGAYPLDWSLPME